MQSTPRSSTMPQTNTKKSRKADAKPANSPQLRKAEPSTKADPDVHVFGNGFRCDTETRGHATPEGRSPLEIVVDASEGFIPLWVKGTTLRWRVRERSLSRFANPAAARKQIRKLFGEALLAWGTAAPVKFKEDADVWDFELVMKAGDDCSPSGCVLASAFFPDTGRHELAVYPKMFT